MTEREIQERVAPIMLWVMWIGNALLGVVNALLSGILLAQNDDWGDRLAALMTGTCAFYICWDLYRRTRQINDVGAWEYVFGERPSE